MAELPEATVRSVYRLLLGREPGPVDRITGFADEAAVLAHVGDLAEYRNRFRDAASSDANAAMAAALWPAASRDYDLQILLISGEGWSKSRAIIERLVPELVPRVLLTVLCGEADEEEFPARDGAELKVLPGLSVFELRALVPTVLRETAWAALLEDHATPHEGWIGAVLAATAAAPSQQLVLTGTATNEVSTRGWDWPNFLFNFTEHWYPSAATTLPGTVTTLVFRRDLVGGRPFRIHEFEEVVIGRRGPVVNAIRVDHRQHTGWWAASAHVFDNGRVAGSAIRRNAVAPQRRLSQSVGWVTGKRLVALRQVLSAHPLRAHLPAGIMLRLRWISFCHSAGAIFGAIFGGGRAHKRLE